MKQWYEMAIVKIKFDEAERKIEKMFDDISYECEHQVMLCGIKCCKNDDHSTNLLGTSTGVCEIEDCPILQNSIDYLKNMK